MPYSGPIATELDSADFPIWNYGYVPSLALGTVGTVLFALMAVVHLFYLIKKSGTRSVHMLFCIAGLVEALSYGCRLSSHFYPLNGMSFILGIAGIQISSILVAAAVYKSIQRGLKYWPTQAKLSPARPRTLIAVFVTLDSICSVLQIATQYLFVSGESALIFKAAPLMLPGTATACFIYLCVLQTVSLIVLTVFVMVIYRRVRRDLNNASSDLAYPHLQALLVQVLISFFLFYVRLFTRIAEGAQGLFEWASVHEWVFGVFESLPILLVLILWAARPLHKFIFPFGHPKERSDVQGSLPVTTFTTSSAPNSSNGNVSEQKV